MTPALVVIYSPKGAREHVLSIISSIKKHNNKKGLISEYVLLNPDSEKLKKAISVGKYKHLILSWTHKMPNWNALLGDGYIAGNLETIHLWCLSKDLYAIVSADETAGPEVLTDNTLQKAKADLCGEARVRLTALGYFATGNPPYGTKIVRVSRRVTNHRGEKRRIHRSLLEPGSPEEREVVRLIFDLYGCRNLSLNRVASLLQSQVVPPPRGSSAWNIGQVKKILTNPVYIGALRYKNLICHDAMAPMVEEWLFYSVQSRYSMEKKRNAGFVGKMRHRR